ncbi:MAG: tetratricopeptide repeat protein [Acaryochloris sp. RU_4_1]|nr:tetratricopeptide repeat protein [Acaryochloris sp. RU_4_1]NJR56764.1 tetratricopeptide repeat protein [Acaryochloris sp. CRU_2_0]
MKLLTRWTVILSLASISWLELPLLRSEGAQALPANPVLVSQTTAKEYINRAISRLNSGDLQGALANASQAIQLDPKFALAYVVRADTHRLLGNFQQALADANQAIQLDPKFAPTYVVRAASYMRLGDLQEALADSNQAIQFNPKIALAYSLRANVRVYLVDFKGALADSNQAIQIDPKSVDGYNQRAQAHIGLGSFHEALADSNQAIQIDPKSVGGYIHRARAYIGLGDFQAALSDTNRAVQMAPKSSDVYAVRAIARIGLGDTEGGLSDAKQAIQIDSKDGDGYYARGLVRLKQGDQQGATTDYNQAIQLEPSLAKELENYTIAQSPVQDAQAAVRPSASPPSSPRTQDPQKSSQPTATRRTPTPTQGIESTQDVYTVAGQTTVLINGQNPGSGVIIAKTNNVYYVLTAKHVVATPDEYKIVVEGGKEYNVDPKKIKRLSKIDLAIVEFTSTQNYAVARLGNSDQVKQGANIYVSGWPLPDQAITKPTQIVTEGRVVGLQTGDKDGYGLLYGNNTAPGMSGGPVLDANGRLIGIHGRAAGDQERGKVGINLGIPINLFLRSADQAGINLQKLGLKARN